MIDHPQNMVVSAYEHGIVRVFLCDSSLRAAIEQSGTYHTLCDALRIDAINPTHVQQLQTRMLGDMSVAQFLSDGYDIREEDLDAHAFKLDALQGTDVLVLIVASGAFDGKPLTLKASDAAQLIATLREEGMNVTFKPLPNPDPEAVVETPPQKKAPSDAAMSGRVATVALLLMGVLVWLMIRIAG